MIPDDSVFNTKAMKLLQEAKVDSLQNTLSSTMSVLPTNTGKNLSNTEDDEPNLAIIITSICGTIAILIIAIAVACIKYDRRNRKRSTESKLSFDINIPLNEAHENSPKVRNETVPACPNDQSTHDSNQSLEVSRENPYLRMNERPALREKKLLEGKDTSSYVQMKRCQIGDLDDPYQSVGDWMTEGEIEEIPHEEFSSSHVTKTGKSCPQLIEVHSGNVGDNVPLQSSVESDIVNNDHTCCNTTI